MNRAGIPKFDEKAVKFRPLAKSWVGRGLPDIDSAQGPDVRHDEGYLSKISMVTRYSFQGLCDPPHA